MNGSVFVSLVVIPNTVQATFANSALVIPSWGLKDPLASTWPFNIASTIWVFAQWLLKSLDCGIFTNNLLSTFATFSNTISLTMFAGTFLAPFLYNVTFKSLFAAPVSSLTISNLAILLSILYFNSFILE